ncbi:MAG: ABC transporter substrate-binding protein [Anaerolineae bacterium]|nr:ABC transporter substrate-binding protein [Anaerolineae bacterium]
MNAAELAAKQVNDAGGLEVNGQKYKITLFIEDNQDKAEVAVAVAQKLINQDNVVAIIGPQASRNAIPVSNIAEASKIPMISPGSTNPETTAGKSYVFRAAFIDPFQGRVMARFTFEELNAQNVAVLYDIASPYNRDIAEIYKAVIEEAGGQVVAFESYTTGEEDFSSQLTNIQTSGAEVLFLPNYHNEVPAQVSQAREMGINIPIIGSDSWVTIEEKDRPLLDGSYFSTHYSTDIANDIAQSFIEAYRQAYEVTPDDIAALTYDAFGLLFNALQQQGKTDPESIRLGLASTENFEGVTGTMEFQGSGDPVKSAVVLKIENGEIVFFDLASP